MCIFFRFRKLCESPYLESVDWARWHVFWADERVVKKDHPDSNYKLAWDGLLSKVPIPLGQVYAINDTLSTEAAAEDYEVCIKQLMKTRVLVEAAQGGRQGQQWSNYTKAGRSWCHN
jgi:6-phosphogluconolactonase